MKHECEVFGCSQEIYNRISIGPGTNIAVCQEHYTEFQKALLPEYPNQHEE